MNAPSPLEERHVCAVCRHRRYGAVQNLLSGKWTCQSCLEAAGQQTLLAEPSPWQAVLFRRDRR